MSPHILILSGLYDYSADLVALQLQHAGGCCQLNEGRSQLNV